MALKFYYAPVAHKVGKTYTALPNQSSADFATCTRSSPATFINQDGLLEEAPNDMPRLDWSNGRYPRLLLEGASQNLFNYSNDFTQWSITNGGTGTTTRTPNYGISPDGNQNATRIEFNISNDSGSSISSLQQGYAQLTTGSTFSIWVKSLNGNVDIVLDLNDNNNTIRTVTNEWTRIERSRTSVSSGTRNCFIGLKGDTSSAKSADILIYEAQMEDGNVATSNIPTSDSPQSRSADTGYNTGSLIDSLSSGEYVLEVKTARVNPSVQSTFLLSQGLSSTSNFASITYLQGGGLAAGFEAYDTSVLYANGSNIDTTLPTVVKIKIKNQDLGVKVNGVEIESSASTVTVPSLYVFQLYSAFQAFSSAEIEYIKIYDSVSDY